MVTIIGAVSGVCFAVLAARGLSVAVVTAHFRVSALVYAAITAFLSYFAFRAALAGRSDEASFVRAVWGGFGGLVVGMVVVFTAYAMLGDSMRTYVARPLGLHLSQVGMFRVTVGFVLLGFAGGFALRIETHGGDEAGTTESE